jgi:hypothetical protein
MTDLRNHLFATLEALRDKEEPMDIQRAKAVCETAQTIINSAKVEVELIKAVGADQPSEFFGAPLESGGRPRLASLPKPNQAS